MLESLSFVHAAIFSHNHSFPALLFTGNLYAARPFAFRKPIYKEVR